VTALIEDDGRGFEPAATREGGFGLVGMRERVALLGGTLRVESRKNAGTTLKVEVPDS
jgi:signal transduction histidine kinase